MVVNILRAGKIIDHKVSEILRELGLTHIQFNILRILEAEHPRKLSLGEVTDGLLFATSDVSRLIDRLVNHGFVSREVCPKNRRQIDLGITDEGFRVIRRAVPKIADSLHGYYRESISEKERQVVIDIMKRIN